MIEKPCTCPNCDTLIPEGEVICTKCAYDLMAQKGD